MTTRVPNTYVNKNHTEKKKKLLLCYFLNCEISMLVKRYLLNEFNLDTFNNYFEITEHKMNTGNNNHFIDCQG